MIDHTQRQPDAESRGTDQRSAAPRVGVPVHDGARPDAPMAAADVLGALDRVLGELGRVDALSQRIGAVLDREDGEAALATVTEREPLVRAIAAESARIEAAWNELLRAGRAGPDVALVTARMDAVAALASRIAERDRIDLARLERLRDAISADIEGLSVGVQANAAYARPAADAPPTRARFQDREA
jgi:hypothetical protein